MNKTTSSVLTTRLVDNTDWLKAIAIVLVAIDHTGYFFIEDADWWSVFGRLAAPPFFFLLGYAKSTKVPAYWVWFGITLTILDSANNGWDWVAPNILLSFALIRICRPFILNFLQTHGWLALVIVLSALLVLMPVASYVVDYGAEGWLWALLGLCQYMYINGKSASTVSSVPQPATSKTQAIINSLRLKRLLVCFVAASIYVWQEQTEFSFSMVQLWVFIAGVLFLCAGLCLFQRAPSRIQPPGLMGDTLRFVGRHTLEIYAIQLAGSEILIMLMPGWAA